MMYHQISQCSLMRTPTLHIDHHPSDNNHVYDPDIDWKRKFPFLWVYLVLALDLVSALDLVLALDLWVTDTLQSSGISCNLDHLLACPLLLGPNQYNIRFFCIVVFQT